MLHLSGHGSNDGIELEDEDGGRQSVAGQELADAIKRAGKPLPLVVLSSCHGGSGSGTGLAAALVQAGVGSVVAMQTAVSDIYATLLAKLFYAEVARHGATPATALAVARQTLEEDRRRARSSSAEVVAAPEWAVATVIGSATEALVDPKRSDDSSG